MEKILFVVPILPGIGGIETALLNLIKNIDREKYSIDLCVYGDYIALPEKIPEDVKIIPGTKEMKYCYVPYNTVKKDLHGLEKFQLYIIKGIKSKLGVQTVVKFVKHKYRFEQYDIAISFANDAVLNGQFVGGGNEIVADRVNARVKIGWIHNEPYRCGCTKEYYEKIYSKFDYIVNVSEACKKMFDELAPSLIKKSRYVYNTFAISEIKRKAELENPVLDENKFQIVTVSRIENNQKRIDRVIEASKILLEKGFNSFQWSVIGNGPDYEMIENKISDTGMQDHITLLGYRANPYPYIKKADILVQTSEFESFGMVLKEAFICGTPVITTNFMAAREVVDDGRNGFIVEKDARAIAEKLELLMRQNGLLNAMKDYIASNPYTNDVAMKQFYELLK